MTLDNVPKKKSDIHKIINSILAGIFITLGLLITYNQLNIQKQTRSIKKLMLHVEQLQTVVQKDFNAQNQVLEQKLAEQELALHNLQMKLKHQAEEKTPSSELSIFLINKAHALLDLAQINAYWTEDKRTTLALLEQADQLLATSKDPKQLPTREAIGQARTNQLKEQNVDVVRILSQLSADQELVNSLALKQDKSKQTKKHRVSSAWEKLHSLVILRRTDTNIPIAYTFTNTKYMRASLALNLENAKWAVLHQQQDIFLLSLQDALKILDSNFDQHESIQLKKRLIDLQQINLSLKTPITQDFILGESK